MQYLTTDYFFQICANTKKTTSPVHMPTYCLTTVPYNHTHANILTYNRPLRPCTCLRSELQQQLSFFNHRPRNVPYNSFLQAYANVTHYDFLQAHGKRADGSDPLSGDAFKYIRIKQTASFNNMSIQYIKNESLSRHMTIAFLAQGKSQQCTTLHHAMSYREVQHIA